MRKNKITVDHEFLARQRAYEKRTSGRFLAALTDAMTNMDFVECWMVEDLLGCLRILSCDGRGLIKRLTGIEPETVYYNPGRGSTASGGPGYQIEVFAAGLVMLEALGVQCGAIEITMPLRVKLKKKKMLTSSGLRVLWADKEIPKTRYVFLWPGKREAKAPMTINRLLDGRFLFGFTNSELEFIELITPTKTKIQDDLFKLGCMEAVHVSSTKLRQMMDNADIPADVPRTVAGFHAYD